MPQQTKTEALEELARLIRRDIMDGTAPLNGVWWFTDDVRLQDRIAHVLLDYSDEEKPTGPTLEEYNALTAALTEKCAALVVENKRLSGYASDDWGHPASDGGTSTECGVAKPERYDNSTLRIDTDMSDPQPGKLLVVRLDDDDVGRAWMLTSALHRERGEDAQPFWPSQFVGFLVETPAVERGAWVVVSHENDVPYYWSGYQWTDDISRAHRWGTHPENWKGAGRAVFMADLEVSE